MTSSLDWDDLRHILAVSESGSAVAAARLLGVNASTVQRKIARFEATHGIHLFERRRRGLHPTPHCLALVEEARKIKDRIDELDRDLLGADQRMEGLLRVTSTETFITPFMARALADFRENHPAIQIELTLTNAQLNLSRQDADVAIRPSRAPHDLLVGQRVAGLRFALYGIADHMSALPSQPDIAALQALPWIGLGDALSAAPPCDWMHAHISREQVGMIVDTFPAMVEAARAGIGVALLPCSLADCEPNLLRGEVPGEPLETSVWVLTHPEIRNAARIKTFMTFMAKRLREDCDRLEGRTDRAPKSSRS
ncbi:MAG: LysR family transcriptional regulator [Ahrensia sp.]|nr:LysR family transcriptional regulator [Ahrensia sp.]